MATSVRVRSLDQGKAHTDALVERLRMNYEDANVPVVNVLSRATLQGNVISAFNNPLPTPTRHRQKPSRRCLRHPLPVRYMPRRS